MKSTALPLPPIGQSKSTVPLFKIILAKKSIFIAACLLLALLAFFSARCTVLTYCSPFALALACAMPAQLMPAAVLGAAAGYLSAGYESVPLRYLAALLLAVIIKRLFSEKTNERPLFSGITALLCCAATGFVASLLLDEINVTLIPYTAESFIAAAASVFWAGSVMYIKRLRHLTALKESEIACLLISVFLIILSLSYITVFELSLAKILACLTILLSAYYGKTGAGSLAGIGAGTALGLGNADAFSFAGLCVGGMLAGLGASHSKLLSCVALEAGIAAPLLFGLGKDATFIPFAEAGIAIVIFLLIPKKALNRFRFLGAQTNSLSAACVKTHAVSRLHYASDALSDVCNGIYEIKNAACAYSPTKKTAIYMNTMRKTCEKCGLKYYCWQREKEYTIGIFKDIEKMLERDEELTQENLPGNFGKMCIKSKALIQHFTLEHTAYRANKLAGARAKGMREVMTVQFDALSQLLFDLSETIEQKEFLESDLTDEVCELLAYCGADYLDASVVSDTQFRLKVNLRIPHRQEVLEKKEFLKDLESICAKSFRPAQVQELGGAYKMSFFETARFECLFGYYQLSAEGNEHCGDAFEILEDFDGKAAAILADGMGKGLSANIDGSLSASILSKLLGAGFSVGSAIKVVNAALMVKDGEESFSSLDLVVLDLFSGRADFYKAGATCSVIKRNNKISKVELSSMPVGILKNADFAHSSLTLAEGDILLLMSDGVTQGESEWLGELLLSAEYDSPQALAKAVCQSASKRQYGVHEDDISAIACFVTAAQT